MIAIWGANGFIGRHLSLAMMRGGEELAFLSKEFDGFPIDLNEKNKRITADFNVPDLYIQDLADCKTIILLVTGSYARTYETVEQEVENNLKPYQTFMDALSKHSSTKPHLIYISSGGAIYGQTEHTPIAETHVLQPINVYGKGKALIEDSLIKFSQQSGFPYTIVRPSNPVGKWGKNLISYAIKAAKEKTEFSIYGDGSAIRDYFAVDDLAKAIRLISENKNAHNQIYNIGSGHGHSITEILSLIESVSGEVIKTHNVDAVDSDVSYNVLDCTKAKKELGWATEKNLKHIIENMWEDL